MEMSGERTIGATRGEVWSALNDPDVLKGCISGCEEMEKTSETSFVARVVQKVGPVKAKFTGEIELSDIVEGESYRISGKGKGGAAGGASGGAAVVLTDTEDGGTLLVYEAEAKVTGKIAQLGARLIKGFAKKMADDFFNRFQAHMEAEEAVEEEAGEAPAQDYGGEQDDGGEQEKPIMTEVAEAIDTVADAVGKAASDVGRAAAGTAPARKSFWKRLIGG